MRAACDNAVRWASRRGNPRGRDRRPGGAVAAAGLARGACRLQRDPQHGLQQIVLAVQHFLDGVPDDQLNEKLGELGIERAEFDRDVAQVRRLTPGPVRRTIRRVPELIGGVGEAMKQLGLGPRTRAWINREDRSA